MAVPQNNENDSCDQQDADRNQLLELCVHHVLTLLETGVYPKSQVENLLKRNTLGDKRTARGSEMPVKCRGSFSLLKKKRTTLFLSLFF